MEYKEVFKDLQFEVSKTGVVRNKFSKYVYSLETTNKGYLRVNTRDSQGKPLKYSVHRLVAIAWIPNPDNLPQVNHKNGIKVDNRVDNLEWCTASYNQLHSIANGLKEVQYGQDVSSSVISDATAIKICEMIQDGYRNCDISDLLDVNRSVIKDIRIGKAWSWISKDYVLNIVRRGRLSINTVEWVCEKLSKGESVKSIMRQNTNLDLKQHHVKAIKQKRSYKDVYDKYISISSETIENTEKSGSE